MSEQHSACTTASKRAKNTRARAKIAEYSDGSSEDELSVSEEEYIPDTSESYTSDSSMSLTASPKEEVTVDSDLEESTSSLKGNDYILSVCSIYVCLINGTSDTHVSVGCKRYSRSVWLGYLKIFRMH
ncbi:uncharacterized protein LOC125243280 isoform X2 [Megalobrama amblycephala]|uniref:uncharacterized protein LOC125243280 isoform X2 n=1 Tax=Megalobrama amblycephala TaxID=75352 RepID=UPI002014159C|nr:uncharacterized protein LOC125243280 isoform X2 [Megalobrama amblycephala]